VDCPNFGMKQIKCSQLNISFSHLLRLRYTTSKRLTTKWKLLSNLILNITHREILKKEIQQKILIWILK